MSFIWPEMRLALLLIPLLVWYYLRQLRQQRLAAADLGSMGFEGGAPSGLGSIRRHMPPLFLALGLGVLLFGLARPQLTVALPRTEGTVILAFDVSNSMAAEDIEPSRLEASKAAARELIEAQPSTVRIGVVAFGGSGLIVQAPTDDQAAALEAVDRIAPQGGTSLGEGLFTSLNAIAGQALAVEQALDEEGAEELRIDDYSSAVIMLFTDGENTDEPDPLEVAQVAAEAGVRVYPVGVGTAEGTTIEAEGFHILTQLDEAMLEAIANTTNGNYYRAEDQEAVQAIFEQVDLQLTTRAEEMEITAIVAGISVLLLLAGGSLSLLWFGRVP